MEEASQKLIKYILALSEFTDSEISRVKQEFSSGLDPHDIMSDRSREGFKIIAPMTEVAFLLTKKLVKSTSSIFSNKKYNINQVSIYIFLIQASCLQNLSLHFPV